MLIKNTYVTKLFLGLFQTSMLELKPVTLFTKNFHHEFLTGAEKSEDIQEWNK